MMLCCRDRCWFLSTGINLEKGQCWLRCGPNMPHPVSFQPLPPAGALVYGSVPFDESIRFFPELRFQGIRVTPTGWHPKSEEPLVRCEIGAGGLGGGRGIDPHEYQRIVDELVNLGWEWDYREGGQGYVHVDDLEKIEGPPPEGAF